MEYLELGDLLDYLDERPALPEIQAQEITYQILEGLKMMHENEFTHRDLKPKASNLFFSPGYLVTMSTSTRWFLGNFYPSRY
jgi:serine/threonine protein kinase